MLHDTYICILIFLFSLLVFFCMCKLLRIANGKIVFPTISSVFMGYYVVFAFIGAVFLNLIENDYAFYPGLYDYPEAIWGMWGLVMAGAVLIPAGMILANSFWNRNSKYALMHFRNTIFNFDAYMHSLFFRVVFLGIALLTFTVCVFYVYQLDAIPFQAIFSGAETKELALLRSESTNDFAGKYYRYNFFKSTVLTLLVLISFYLRKQLFFKICFVLLLMLRIGMCIISLEKAPMLDLIILLFLAYFYQKRVLSKKLIAITIITLSILVFAMVVFFMGNDASSLEGLQNIWMGIFNRVLLGQIICLAWYIVFVDRYGYLNGATLPNPAGILPFDNVRYTVDVMDMVHPSLQQYGIVGSMPTIFFGEFYLDFGVGLALVSMPVIGFLLRTLDIYFQNRGSKKTDMLYLTGYVFLIMFLKKYVMTGISGIILDVDLYGMVIILGMLVFSKGIHLVARK